jgi:hypothetical protein
MEILIIGMIAAMVFVGLIALDPHSPNARRNMVGLMRGTVIGLLLIGWWLFGASWVKALLSAI